MGRIENPCFSGTAILKPREHAKRDGISSLSDAELIALLLNTGSKKENVVALSQRILSEKGGLRGVFLNPIPLETKGVKEGKTFRLLAVREIMKRIPLSVSDSILDSESAFAKTKFHFLNQKKEIALVLYLGQKKELLMKDIFYDEERKNVKLPLEKVVRRCILSNCKFLILLHNHPSGKLSPSEEDIRFCCILERKLSLISVVFLDSIIVDDNRFLSMRGEGISPFE